MFEKSNFYVTSIYFFLENPNEWYQLLFNCPFELLFAYRFVEKILNVGLKIEDGENLLGLLLFFDEMGHFADKECLECFVKILSLELLFLF